MKKGRNLLLILLTLAVVAAGLLVPEYLLKKDRAPEFELDYQAVEISSMSTTDYAWRMGRIANLYYTDARDLQFTNITSRYSEEEQSDLLAQILQQLQILEDDGVFPGERLDFAHWDAAIKCYYLFDNANVSGFRVAVLDAVSQDGYNSAQVYMDMESGKIATIHIFGSISFDLASETVDWDSALRLFADYLGLGSDTPTRTLQFEDDTSYYDYYDQIAVASLMAPAPYPGSSWLELRVEQNNGLLGITVYRQGK